jgi:hypothetical protein
MIAPPDPLPDPPQVRDAMDPLADLLRTMKLSGGVFLEAEFSAPWCVTAQVGPEDCQPFAPVPAQVIAYHYVVAGGFLLQCEGEPPVSVAAGEIVVMPRNDRHTLGSARHLPVSADHLLIPPAMAVWRASSMAVAASAPRSSAAFSAVTRAITHSSRPCPRS